jgi:hypothetical protein
MLPGICTSEKTAAMLRSSLRLICGLRFHNGESALLQVRDRHGPNHEIVLYYQNRGEALPLRNSGPVTHTQTTLN